MTDVLNWHPRPPSAMGERPGTADVTGIRAATPGASCDRTLTVRNFDLTPADTPGAPKPRKTRGRTPKAGEGAEPAQNLPSLAASPLFATLMSSRMSASMQRPGSAMSSPAFDSPTMPNDAAMMSFSNAFKDISLDGSKQLPNLKLAAKDQQSPSDFGENVGVARRARLGVAAEETPPAARPKAEAEEEIVELVQRPESRCGFAPTDSYVDSPTGSEEGNSPSDGTGATEAQAEQPDAPQRQSQGGRPVPRNLFAAETHTVCPESPHMPHPPPKR
jgi:hypothetical protein|eukprot:COSAG06_NODE_1677_length_8739_cov_2882.835532_2_plen_275_part_00